MDLENSYMPGLAIIAMSTLHCYRPIYYLKEVCKKLPLALGTTIQ